jgi:hypothetical protein
MDNRRMPHLKCHDSDQITLTLACAPVKLSGRLTRTHVDSAHQMPRAQFRRRTWLLPKKHMIIINTDMMGHITEVG